MAQEGATFGDRLKALRKRTGKSQDEIANEINQQYGGQIRLSQTKLSALEQRETAPRQEILEVFADYFRIPIAYFFDPIRKEQLESVKDYVQTRRNSEPARSYLEKLMAARIGDNPILARSTEPRRAGDDVEESLSNRQGQPSATSERPEAWQPKYDDGEYWDT